MQQGGLIGIRNFRQGDDIVFEISDNGRGLSGEKDSDAASSKTGGYGLYNINERLTRHFGADYGLRITDNPGGGTLVVLRIAACSLYSHKSETSASPQEYLYKTNLAPLENLHSVYTSKVNSP